MYVISFYKIISIDNKGGKIFMKFKSLSLLAGLVTSLYMFSPVTAAISYAEEEESETAIFSDDFESDVISSWSVLGGKGTLSIDTEHAQSGSSSLKIAEREQFFNSPSLALDSYFEAEETYRVCGWLYHESSQTEAISCTLRFSDSVNVDSYAGVATIDVEPKTWTYFEGTVETPEDLSSTLLYFDCQNVELEYNIDDIRVYGKKPVQSNGNAGAADKSHKTDSYVFDFENGFNEWANRGNTRLIRTNDQHLSGNYSLFSTNREKVWSGPTVSIDSIERGKEYTFESNVFYDEKKARDTQVFLMELQYSYNGNEVYSRIASCEAVKNEWANISGVFTVPEGATNVMLYLQTENPAEGEVAVEEDLISFYIDDISVLRSDMLLNNKTIITVLIITGASILVLMFLFIIIRKSITNKKDNSENMAASEVISNFDKEQKITPDTDSDAAKNKTEEVPPKAPEKSEEKTSGDKTAEKTSNNSKKSGKNKSGGKSGQNNTSKNNSQKTENSKESKNQNTEKTDKSDKKEKVSETSDTQNKSGESTDNSRARDIFNIETFSYDEDSIKSEDDNPLDSPFEGF